MTNDFPPRVGGVQQYVHSLVRHLPPDRVTVLAPDWPGAAAFDAAQPFAVERGGASNLRPTREIGRRVADLLREARAEVVLFGHGLPLGLLGPSVAAGGVPYVVLTHGTEYWFSLLPGTALALRRATSGASRVLAISRSTARVIRTVVPDRVPMSLLPPGVDVDRFHPEVSGGDVRRRHGLEDRPLVVCVSRLVPRKGQDVLIRSMARVRAVAPDAALLVVGDGRYGDRLRAMASDAPAGSVTFAGEVPDAELPAHHAAADVFAMPCRSRFGGLEIEGFGIVYLEAAATGRSAVAGDSGGAAEAVLDGATGLVVDGREEEAVAGAVGALLADPDRASAMGRAGRARVEERFAWPGLAERAAGFLLEAVEEGPRS